jgi:hypothetical protein
MNGWRMNTLEGHWRLQDLPDWDVTLNVDFSDGPIIRSFAVFHNQVEIGRLEIRCRYDYSRETPNVFTEVRLHSVRLLDFDSITDFLSTIAAHVCEKGDELSHANTAITTALTKSLWQTQEISEYEDLDGQGWGELSLHLQGRASRLYFDRREALRAKRQGPDRARPLTA